MKYFSLTDKGLVRDNNEDSIACDTIGGCFCMVIADGLGGQEKGELASSIASSSLLDILRENEDLLSKFDEPQIVKMFEESFQKVNNKILLRASGDKSSSGMSTTLTCAVMSEKRIIIAHIGDCRVYSLHGSKLMCLTKDHTYAEVLRQSKSGDISEEELRKARNVLTKYLGENIFITPDIYRYNIVYGDLICLCSDGLYAYIGEEELRQNLRVHSDLEKCAHNLIDEVYRNGAKDNVSVILAHNRPNDKKE